MSGIFNKKWLKLLKNATIALPFQFQTVREGNAISTDSISIKIKQIDYQDCIE